MWKSSRTRLLSVGAVLLVGCGAGPARAQQTTPPADALYMEVVPRVAVEQIREDVEQARRSVREALAEAMRVHEVRGAVHVAVREQIRAAREARRIDLEIGDVWRDAFDDCPAQIGAWQRHDGLVGGLAHVLIEAATGLTPKLGVLIATGAKLLGRLLASL